MMVSGAKQALLGIYDASAIVLSTMCESSHLILKNLEEDHSLKEQAQNCQVVFGRSHRWSPCSFKLTCREVK